MAGKTATLLNGNLCHHVFQTPAKFHRDMNVPISLGLEIFEEKENSDKMSIKMKSVSENLYQFLV